MGAIRGRGGEDGEGREGPGVGVVGREPEYQTGHKLTSEKRSENF